MNKRTLPVAGDGEAEDGVADSVDWAVEPGMVEAPRPDERVAVA
jgi:hypothetical protein